MAATGSVTGSDDDDFDTDFGYNGSLQFMLGIKRTGNGSSDPRNLEVDSNNNREASPRQFCGWPISPSSRRSISRIS
jgi:hypothetical protein